MRMASPETDSTSFYNVTIEDDNGVTEMYVIKYTPEETWLDNKDQPYEGNITTARVNNFTHILPDDQGGGTSDDYGDLGYNFTEPQGSPYYPTDCNGIVYVTMESIPYQCSCEDHWPNQTCYCGINGNPGYQPGFNEVPYYYCDENSDTIDDSEQNGNTNTDTTTGGTTTTGSGNNSNPDNNLITVTLTPVICSPKPRGDLNQDCILDAEETYLNIKQCLEQNDYVLTQPQIDWLQNPLNFTQTTTINNYLQNNNCSQEAQEEMIEMLKLIIGMDKECQAIELFRSVYRVNSTFTNMIKNYFFTQNSTNHLNLQDISTGEGVPPMPSTTGARVQPYPGNFGSELAMIVEFNNSHLDSSTTLGFVNTFYHELIHAYILHLYHSDELLNEYPGYTGLKNAMDDYFADSNNQTLADIYNEEMHNIYIDFIDDIAESLVEYCNNNNISGVNISYAKKLVWGGLNGYTIFNNNLTPDERLEAQTLLAHENFNNTDYAKGTKTCN